MPALLRTKQLSRRTDIAIDGARGRGFFAAPGVPRSKERGFFYLYPSRLSAFLASSASLPGVVKP